jgi:GAF domain-containing protein
LLTVEVIKDDGRPAWNGAHRCGAHRFVVTGDDHPCMVKLWHRSTVTAPDELENQQQKLARLSGDVLRQYRRDLDVEVNDPQRLEAIYGSGFMRAEATKQSEVVAVMATQMLSVPNAIVSVVLPDGQYNVAWIVDNESVRVDLSQPASTLPDSYCSHVIGTGREVNIETSVDHPLVCDTKWARGGEIVSYLGVPVANRHAIIVGTLCVYDSCERQWAPADVSMLTQLSLVLTRTVDPVVS